ncbi:MAG: FtsX-like permease family protein, partial [Bacteroidaceae bacterium]|nr:FtsX-like permease family protein [Bacteroidaceae bacterium]
NRRLMSPVGPSGWTVAHITMTYDHGMKDVLRNEVARIMDEAGLEYELTFPEDRFFESLASQEHLKNLVMGLGIICIFIAIFGTYSMIVLACRERRREIAVRKVHGAKVGDIIGIFGREYGGTLLLSTILAFSVGYIFMHRWIQQYERQITISWWIYAVILVAMVIVISLTVGHQVLKTARENPAEVIKSE